MGRGGELTTADKLLRFAGTGLVVTLGLAVTLLAWRGHTAFNTSSQLPWGLPVSTYLFLVLTATGLTFVSSFSLVFGFHEFAPVAKRTAWMSIAALVGGFTSLGLEIGHPLRMVWALPTGLQYVSPMFWMGLFYSIYLVLVILKFLRIHAGDWHSPLSHRVGIAAFVTVVIAHSTLGLVFGMMTMRPLWYDGMISVNFLFLSAIGGAAFTVLLTYHAYDFKQENMPTPLRELASGTALPKIFATLVGLGILMVVDRTITGIWSNLDGFQVYDELLRSPVWHFGLWGGLIAPFVILLIPRLQRQPKWQLRAAVLAIVGMFIIFYYYVVGGQQVPVFRGAWQPDLIAYVPSFGEWMLSLSGIFLMLTIYAIGEKYLNLGDNPESQG
jgi:molybdopterin-containing oxidoreductase family membrane subunit